MHLISTRTLAVALILGSTSCLFAQVPLETGPIPMALKQTPLESDANQQGGPTKPGSAQETAPDKKSAPLPIKLEDQIKLALSRNPDILLAQIKVAEAEAELNRSRQVLIQKIITHRANVEHAEAVVGEAAARLDSITNAIHKVPASYSKEDLRSAAATLITAKAELAKIQAELPLLLGTPGAIAGLNGGEGFLAQVPYLRRLFENPDLSDRNVAIAHNEAITRELLAAQRTPVQGPMVERIKTALDREVKIELNGSTEDLLEFLLSQVRGVPYRSQLRDITLPKDAKLSLSEKVPLGAAFQAVQDMLPEIRFVVRDYGILVTDAKHVPPGAPLLLDVWKGTAVTGKPAANKVPEKTPGPNAPKE